MAWICVKNMMQVKREKRKPSNTPNRLRMNTSGPGSTASQPGGMEGGREGEREGGNDHEWV